MGQQIDSAEEADKSESVQHFPSTILRRTRTVSIAVDTLDLDVHFSYCCRHAPKPSQSVGTDTFDLNQNAISLGSAKTVSGENERSEISMCLQKSSGPWKSSEYDQESFSNFFDAKVSKKDSKAEECSTNHGREEQYDPETHKDDMSTEDEISGPSTQNECALDCKDDFDQPYDSYSDVIADDALTDHENEKTEENETDDLYIHSEEEEEEENEDENKIADYVFDMDDQKAEEEIDEEDENCEEEGDVENNDYELIELTACKKENIGNENMRIIDDVQNTTYQVVDDGVVIATSKIGITGSPEEEKQYHCCNCEAIFTEQHQVISHLSSHPNLLPFQCVICGSSRATENDARNHYSEHPKLILNKCDFCGQDFSSRKLLDEHLSLHTEGISYPCTKCQKTFRSAGTLAKHMQTHSPHEPLYAEGYNCSHCNKCFVTQADCERHERWKHSDHSSQQPIDEQKVNQNSNKGAPRWNCSTCGKVFRNSKALREHEVVHTGARDFPCNICGKAFGTAANMRIHRLTHSDKKPHACQTCGATFRQKDSLKVHFRKHTGERPYVCSICKMAFDRSFTLKNHMLTHATVKSFVCAVCGKAFTTRGGLNNHERLHFKDPNEKKDRKPRAKPGTGDWICDECGKIYSTRSNLRMHQKTHQPAQVLIPCPVCGKEYKSRDSMEVHKRRHTEERPYSCNLCTRSFYRNYTLKLHILTHTGEKPHHCPVEGCNKSFAQTSSLAYHVRNHKKQEERSKCSNLKSQYVGINKLTEDFVCERSVSNKTDVNNQLRRGVDGNKHLCGNSLDVQQDVKSTINHTNHLMSQNIVERIALSNSPAEEGHVQSSLEATDSLSHHIPNPSALVWEDNMGIMNIVNDVQHQSHPPISHHPTEMHLHQHHQQQVQLHQVEQMQTVQTVEQVEPVQTAQTVHLMQLVPADSLPLLVSVPEGVLYQDSHHKSGTPNGIGDQDYVYNSNKV